MNSTNTFFQSDQWRATQVPKLLGADTELANFLSGPTVRGSTGRLSAQMLLSKIDGVYQSPHLATISPTPLLDIYASEINDANLDEDELTEGQTKKKKRTAYHVQDWGRKFLPTNGGGAYIDLEHLELPQCEVRSAHECVASWQAMLRIARQSAETVNIQLPEEMRIHVLANNSDGLGHSYGSHLNVLISRDAFNNIHHRKMQYLMYLAAFQASSIVITGQGKVGSENGAPGVDYQIAQRADFCEALTGLQTTFRRPIVNSRDEALCGPYGYQNRDISEAHRFARLHVIFYDSNMCHVACLLKLGMLQMITAMIEAEFVNAELILEDPVQTVVKWSHDPTLRTKAPLLSGREVTSVELLRRFFNEAQEFHSRGGYELVVPRADEILKLWDQVLSRLEDNDFDALASQLDWVLKKSLIEQAISGHSELTWQSPEVKQLDHLYSSVDTADGLYWAMEQAGAVQQVVSRAEIERSIYEPPEDTRAWTRAQILRLARREQITYVDWDEIRIETRSPTGGLVNRTIPMSNPLGMTRDETEHLFASGSLEEVLSVLSFVDSQAVVPYQGNVYSSPN